MDTIITVRDLLVGFNILLLLFLLFTFVKYWIKHNVRKITIDELKNELGEDYRKYKGL